MRCGVFKTFAACRDKSFGCKIAAWRTGILQQFTAFLSAWLTTSNADGNGDEYVGAGVRAGAGVGVVDGDGNRDAGN